MTQSVGPEDRKDGTKEINYIVDLYLSWITQLVRVLTWKAKGPGSSPGTG